MKRTLLIVALVLLGEASPAAEPKWEPLPAAVSNNAVAQLKFGEQLLLFSLMGIGPKKTWDAITNTAYVLDTSTGKWSEIRPVPGPAGRLAAAAAGVRGTVYLFGGYVVDGQGQETTVADVSVYEPEVHRWYRGADIPVPVDDSVIGVYHDRYIYLVGGWSKIDTVRNVQVYDMEKNTWKQASPIPGMPVFGHAGALLDDTIVYVDGA